MKTVRFVSNILFYASRVGASFFLLTTFYAVIVVLLFANSHSSAIPMRVITATRGFAQPERVPPRTLSGPDNHGRTMRSGPAGGWM